MVSQDNGSGVTMAQCVCSFTTCREVVVSHEASNSEVDWDKLCGSNGVYAVKSPRVQSRHDTPIRKEV